MVEDQTGTTSRRRRAKRERVVIHLPAIILHLGAREVWTMVSACGKRGPIRRREDAATPIGELQLDLTSPDFAVCEECAVRWDQAEDAGGLRVGWCATARREWAAAGGVIHVEQPMPWRCKQCGRSDSSLFSPEPIAVMVREDRTKARRA